MKGYEVTVDLPNLPKGADVQVHGLGLLQNGDTTFVTEDQANHWRAMNSTQVGEFDSETGAYTAKEAKSGTLLQVLGKTDGFKVVKAERSDNEESDVVTEQNIQEHLPLDQQEEGGEQA